MPLPEFEGEEFKFPDEEDEKKEQEAEKLEIEIEDDTPEEDRGRKPSKRPIEEVTDEELESYDEKVQSRIKRFTRGYHDERRAKEQALREREAAEQFARQVYEENKKLKEQLSTGSKAYIETSKTAAEAELEAAKARYKKAYEEANPDEIVQAQEQIAKATVKLDRAGSMQPIEMEEEREFKVPTPRAPETPKVSRRTQAWIDSNSDWFGPDSEMTMAAMGLDKKLQAKYGADYVGTKEYFDTIDRTMRKRFPEYFDDAQSDEDNEPPPKKRAEPADEDETPRRASKSATVVAPASRSTPPNRIRLRESQAAIARRLGVPLELYAKQVAQLNRGE